MKESDFQDDEYFWLPVPKTVAYRYWFQFPGKNDEDFIREMPAILEGALNAIAKMKRRQQHVSPIKGPKERQPILIEQPYVKEELPEEAKKYYW